MRGQVSSFNVPVNEVPVTMREDTQLVLTEYPGLNAGKEENQAGRAYLEKNYDQLDAVIVVVDSRQSVDYPDQVETLELVRKLSSAGNKNVPIFILCNKVDDPDNLGPEEDIKLSAVREQVQNIWGVGCRKLALEQLLKSTECLKYNATSPIFVPVSPKIAFLLRAGSAMTKSEFLGNMDKDNYRVIGQQEFGKEWKTMSDLEKADSVYDLLKVSHAELLRMSGFGNFLTGLQKSVGGDNNQIGLIGQKLTIELNKCNFGDGEILPKLRSINDKLETLEQSKSPLKSKFWDSYPGWADTALEAFDNDWKPEGIAIPAQRLLEYQRFCMDLGWTDDIDKIQKELAVLVERMLVTINNKANAWSIEGWSGWRTEESIVETSKNKRSVSEETSTTWAGLSPIDWQNIISSILLLRSENTFCESFGQGIVFLEQHQGRFQVKSLCCPDCETSPFTSDCCDCDKFQDYSKFCFEDSFKNPCISLNHNKDFLKVIVPENSSTSEHHFAHVGWLFCKALAESRKYLETCY